MSVVNAYNVSYEVRATIRNDSRAGMTRRRDQNRTSTPNLFDFVPKNVWREVYRGRWAELRRIQKAEFMVEVAFFLLFIGSFVRNSYLHEGNVLGLVLSFGVVWLVLGAFFLLLTRFVR